MVRVLSCHHFTSQNVIATQHEPLAMYSSDDKLFVATSQGYIEVYDLVSNDCRQIRRFPSVGVVKDIVFSETDDYIATLEGATSSEGSVRVYLKWRADLSQHPMRARVAGDLASLRQCESENDQRMEVVAIPLKHKATCIGIDGSTGNLAVGVGNGVLVYALCCKIVECANGDVCGFEDMKCLLELTFGFKVSKVALCEEYIAVASDAQFQAVRLNMKSIPPPTKFGTERKAEGCCPYIRKNMSSSSLEDQLKVESAKDHTAGEKLEVPTHKSGDSGLESSSSHSEDSTDVSAPKPVRPMFSRQSSNSRTASLLDYDRLSSSGSVEELGRGGQPGTALGSREQGYPVVIEETEPSDVIEDEYHVVLNTTDGPTEEVSSGFARHGPRNLAGLGAASMEQKTVILKSVQKAREEQAEETAKKSRDFGIEILGPKIKHPVCPVRVEFESVCCGCPQKQSSDLVKRGAITCVYKRLGRYDVNFHSLQLLSLYSKGGPRTKNNDSWEEFISVRRGDLVGMFCFVSTSQEGYLYDVMGNVSMVTTYPYASPCIQARLGRHLLYAATTQSMEVYTIRCLPTVLQRQLLPNEVLPDKSLEICLVGLQPFIGLVRVTMSLSRIVLLTKMRAEANSGMEEDSWGLYALHKPSLLDMCEDMMELGEQHRAASFSTYLHLLQECHLLVRSHLYLISDEGCHDYRCHDDDVACYGTKIGSLKKMVARSALKLGHYYAGRTDDLFKQASPYYVLSGATLHDIVTYWKNEGCSKKERQPLKGLVKHLDHVLLGDGPSLAELLQHDSSWVLELYSVEKPSGLSAVILKSSFKEYDSERALEMLGQRKIGNKHQDKSRDADVLAMVVLQLRLGNVAEAEALLFSLDKKRLVSVCVENHQVLHQNGTSLSPLSQLLRRHEPEALIRMLAKLHDLNVLGMDAAIALLQGAAPTEGDEGKGSLSTLGSHSSQHLMQYLELLLSDNSRRETFKKAAAMLVPLYLNRLRKGCCRSGGKILSIKEIIPKVQGHFGKRFGWLDHLPPFKGPDSLRKSCLYLAQNDNMLGRPKLALASRPLNMMRAASPQHPENAALTECTCATCWAELLKLQALLAYKHADLDLLRHIMEVTDVEDASQQVSGRDSLLALCLLKINAKASCQLIMEKHPALLAWFLTQTIKDIELWTYVTSSLFENVRQLERMTERDEEKYNVQKTVLKDVLSELAGRLPPKDFVGLLPNEGNTDFLLEFVEKSLKLQQSKDLLLLMQQKLQVAEHEL